MINIHFVMMGKGGVGKSTTAVILAQNHKAKDDDLCSADLDPTNATFSAYQVLNAEHINIADKEFNIDTAKCDVLLEKVLSAENQWVIDTGGRYLPAPNAVLNQE